MRGCPPRDLAHPSGTWWYLASSTLGDCCTWRPLQQGMMQGLGAMQEAGSERDWPVLAGCLPARFR